MSRASVCVVIPIYNGAERVPVLLEALALQDAPDGTFEVVVVDNASTDRVAQSIWRQPPIKKLARRSIPFRVIEEPRQGLTYARIKGVLAASAPILCFCDDDTIPASDFIRRGVEVFADPRVGLVVSAVFPHFEVPPPPSVARRLRIFAASYQLGTEPISFGAEATLAPTVGAGLWLRREAFLKAVPWRHPEQLMHDRRGNQLTSGGDIEIGFLVGKGGYDRLYRPELRVQHSITACRIKATRVCALIAGIARSQLLLEHRYMGRTYTFKWRIAAILRLFAAMVAVPILPFIRRDPVREAAFILTRRWALLRGPA